MKYMTSLKNVKIPMILFLIVLVTLSLQAQDYLWPTNASELLTSSFAESRPGRFHAGIDIKTWGQTGFPIYAVRSGHVSRIRVSPFGYGRAVYLTLDTGEIVVYGHLEKFNADIEAYVKTEQNRRGSFALQLYPAQNMFPVEQGDVLGFTGQSGVGYPHLHFEMRDAHSNPINPFLKGYRVKDTVGPTITKLLIQPLDALSSVDGDVVPQIYWPSRIGEGIYVLAREVQVFGRVALGFSAYDTMEGVTNKFGTYRNELYINNQLIFAGQYDRFSYSVNNHFNMDRDYRQHILGKGFFYNLYLDYSNQLPFYSSKKLYSGVLDISQNGSPSQNQLQPHTLVEIPAGVSELSGSVFEFKVVCMDYWGNTSQVSGILRSDENSRDSIHQGYEKKNDSPAFDLMSYTPGDPCYTMDDDSSALLALTPKFYDRYIRLQVDAKVELSRIPQVSGWLCSGKEYRVPLIEKSTNRYIGAWPLSACVKGPLPLTLCAVTADQDTVVQKHWLEFTTIARGQTEIVESRDGMCRIAFSPRSLFKDIFVRTRGMPAEDLKNYDIGSLLYTIEPYDVPLNEGVTLTMAFRENDPLPGKLGIYQVYGQRAIFVGNRFNWNERTISTGVSALGTFALLRDIDPPEIYMLSPANGSRVDTGYPQLRASFHDSMSGISGEGNRLLKLDGSKVIAEYDPEAKVLFYTPDAPLEPGPHVVELFVKDRCGNAATLRHAFRVEAL